MIPLVSFLLFVLIAVRGVVTTPFPAPDELQHLSYAAFLQQTGRLLPSFVQQKTLHSEDFTRWDGRANYIGHPSPFYLLIGLVLDRALPPARAILAPRLMSGFIAATGVALALWAGFRSFRRNRAALVLVCTLVAVCPDLLLIARQVNNDSLAVLGGGLAYCAAAVPGRVWPAPAAALGLLLASWAKLNAGLDVAVLLMFVLLLREAWDRRWAVCVAVGGLLGAVPYVIMLRDYGALVPVTAEAAGQVPHMNGFSGYVPAFLLHIGYTWEFHRTGLWPPMNAINRLTILAFWMMIGGAGIGAWLAGKRLPQRQAVVAVAGPLAFLAVLPIHIWFSAAELGYSLPAASFRYYLPLWPALAHALAYAVMAAPTPPYRAAVTAIAAAALGLGWTANAFCC